MKYGVIGDTHFGVRGGNADFLNFQINWLSTTLNAMKAQGITKVIQVGDMFDNRKSMDSLVGSVVDRTLRFLLEQLGMEMTILVGNHNIYYRDDNEVTNMWFLENNPRIRIVRGTLEEDGILYLGWINKNNHDEMMEAVQKSSAGYCFGHLEFEGFPMYKGVLATHGMSQTNFKKFKLVVSGHYHTVSYDQNVVYAGSPFHLTWSDYPDGEERGWFVFDSDDGTLGLQRNRTQDTLFAIHEYDPTKSLEEIDLRYLEGKISRVVVRDMGDTRRYNKFLAALRQLKVIECKVVDHTIVNVDKKDISIDTSKIVTNIMATIVDYAAELAASVEGADVGVTRNMAVELYQGVNK